LSQQFINIKPETFCINPWYWLRINTAGGISYCPRATDQWADNTGSIDTEFINNKEITSARKSMTEGNFPKGCNRCAPEEKTGGSFRKSQNLLAAVHHDWFYESLTQSPVTARFSSNDIKPHAMYVAFSNECNLSCRMCTRLSSSKLSEVYNQHNYVVNYHLADGTGAQREKISGAPSISWAADESQWKKFLNFILSNTDLIQLQINGGEPLIQKRFTELINHCIQNNRVNLRLVITSNGTVVDVDLLSKLQKFSHCFIDISVETFHPSNNYIRVGSDYNEILKNIRTLMKFSSSNFKLAIHTTPQIYSVENIDTVIDFCIEHNLDLIANQVHPQRHLHVVVLPPETKSTIYNLLIKKYTNVTKNSSISQSINKLLNWLSMEEPDDIDTLRKLFVKETIDHDAMLGTNFSELYPHLVSYYENYGYEYN